MSDFGAIAVYRGGGRNFRKPLGTLTRHSDAAFRSWSAVRFLPAGMTRNSNAAYRAWTQARFLPAGLTRSSDSSFREWTLRRFLENLFYCAHPEGNVVAWMEAGANFSHEHSTWFSNKLSGTALNSEGAPLIGYPLGLYHRGSMRLIAKTETDALGHYEFSNLRSAPDFFVVCLDPTLSIDAMAHDYLTPGS